MAHIQTMIAYVILLIQLQTIMAEEQPRESPPFCIQKSFEKGPLHLIPSFRISQLQNKVHFFQGQIDPLLEQNISLKDQLVHLTKLVISSTDILRNLLPSSEHPSKKLEMASIEQIAKLIKEDWHVMECTLEQNRQHIIKLDEEKSNWRSKFEKQKEERAKQVKKLHDTLTADKRSYESRIAGLQLEMAQLQQLHQTQKKQMNADFADKLKSYQIKQREFQLFKRQSKTKQEQFQKRVNRLKEEIDANQLSFQQAKKNIKLIYDKLMADKLSEQSQNFELLLKMKEEQKIEVLLLMGEAQEQHKRKSAQKQYEITKLTQRNGRYSEQVGALKNQVWKKQLQLDRQFQEAKAKEEQILKLEQDKVDLCKEMANQEQQHSLDKKRLKDIIQSKDLQLSMLLAEGNQSIQKILAQKQLVEKKLQQSNQKLVEAELAMKQDAASWQKQVAGIRRQWRAEAEKLKAQLAEQKKTVQKWFEMQQQSQKEKALNEIQFAEKLKKIQDIHRQQIYVIQSKYGVQICKMKERHQQTLEHISKTDQQQIADFIANYNQEKRQLVANCNTKLAQQEADFVSQRTQLEKQLKTVEDDVRQMGKRLVQAQLILEQQQARHRSVINQLAEQAQLQRQKLQQMMVKQRREFEDEIQKQQARLISIKAQMENEIKMLKQSNAISSIQDRFMNEINKLKQEFAEKIKQNNLACQKEVEDLNQAHHGQVSLLKEGHSKDLTQIAKNIEQKSSLLNERLMHGLNDSQLVGLNEQEKKQFIIHKVLQIKKSNQEKENKIVEMEYALDQAEKTVEKRVKARKEELEREKDILARQCNRKVETITSECNAKIAQVQKERIQYSQKMYEEFQALRERHRNEMDNLTKKYIELQMIFQQRPSRMEDLTKIKELMNMQTKLDIEIQGYHKKMETANEIVKYLNLQLQNYKDTYDIFGTNGQGFAGGGVVGVSAMKPNNSDNQQDTRRILEVIKEHRHASEAKILSEQRKEMKELLPFRRFNDTTSPAIKEVKLFQDDLSEHSALISNQHSESKQKQKKYSYLMVDRNGQRRNRFKTQKNEHEAQIMINAENFIKLIKGSIEDAPPVIKEVGQRRKSYRKRKLHKRQPTAGFDHYF